MNTELAQTATRPPPGRAEAFRNHAREHGLATLGLAAGFGLMMVLDTTLG